MTEEALRKLPGFNALMHAAVVGNWEVVDKQIPQFCDDPTVFSWAFSEGLNHANGDVRDLERA